jgi:glutaminyl-tRNA synthetase
VRLRYGYIIKCVGADKDAAGNVVAVHCTYDPATRSGTAGAEARKVKGNIHWLSAAHAQPAEVRLYDRLFVVPEPGRARESIEVAEVAVATVTTGAIDEDVEFVEPMERNYLDDLNPQGKRVITAYVEPALAMAEPESRYQFERHGYFIADPRDSKPGSPVFNRAVTLRDSWGKGG